MGNFFRGGDSYSYILVYGLSKQSILNPKSLFQKKLIWQNTNIWYELPQLLIFRRPCTGNNHAAKEAIYENHFIILILHFYAPATPALMTSQSRSPLLCDALMNCLVERANKCCKNVVRLFSLIWLWPPISNDKLPALAMQGICFAFLAPDIFHEYAIFAS